MTRAAAHPASATRTPAPLCGGCLRPLPTRTTAGSCRQPLSHQPRHHRFPLLFGSSASRPLPSSQPSSFLPPVVASRTTVPSLRSGWWCVRNPARRSSVARARPGSGPRHRAARCRSPAPGQAPGLFLSLREMLAFI
ncbi:hypothetical protein BDA96_05G050100 [Sorghum bicolor]|uniref:Uncharacterized protein n=1 Tax=Sorghum bicolor TaxID=4558 RepID=A0A921QWA5_SORBI|nr:hypothetical protein BDA96_05G050100 [Sorghum bicolor]